MRNHADFLFCGIELGERIERAEAEFIAAGSAAALERVGDDGGFVIGLAGGFACHTEAGSPLNKVAGLGFAGVPAAGELDEVERRCAAVGAPVQVELAHLGAPEVAETLTARGYRLVGFENVLGRSLGDARAATVPPGIEVLRGDDTDFDRWADTVVGGFAVPDAQGVAPHEDFPRDVLERAVRDLAAAAGTRRYTALVDGEVAGGSSMRVTQGIAQLTGAATLPAHRRRGVQSALLAARLAEAAAQGCDLAVVTTQPASKSQQNAQRQGFSLLYTRAILVKP
ncbi:GNAT family acetyltransferase [Streptomyces minutiscleroticus]|uniref:GNAT family acetyltransferase n=1 Tax=Streptomyces minutiscleroticus TaxID=68238 RepID=A0A918KF38_9ACTN|nr:GNAT family N-acetyltransferase [Streptomyces minutiscleroticus]GGX60490.1 GNAT family acetyltransferase [Streptomyces minutiscleroticus]